LASSGEAENPYAKEFTQNIDRRLPLKILGNQTPPGRLSRHEFQAGVVISLNQRSKSLNKIFLGFWLAIAILVTLPAFPAIAADSTNGGKIFSANCAACHLGGNNVIIADKNLKKAALEKYNMNSLEAIVGQVTNGKNAMPSFKGRLNQSQIEDVATYVLEQSEKNWQSS
jgi:cytochrome c6